MNDELRLNLDLLPGPHEFTIMHPFDDIEYASMLQYCDSLLIDAELISRFPRGSRLFVDGNEAGRLVDVFVRIE